MKKLTKAALLASAVVAAGAFMGCSSDVDSKDTTVETFKAKEIENLKITNVDNRALVIKWDVTESVRALDLYKKGWRRQLDTRSRRRYKPKSNSPNI